MGAHPRILSVASGGGGLDRGVRLAYPGARTICYVENDAAACAVLVESARNGWLDDAPVWTDARTFDGKPWRGVVDILVAGYPCQPFSQSGKRRGAGDERNLWPAVLRIISECQPSAVFLENVEGHLRLGYFDAVEPDLARAGYTGPPPLLVSASAVGAPHRRNRIFVLKHLAESNGGGWNADHLSETATGVEGRAAGAGQAVHVPVGNGGAALDDASGPRPQVWPPGPGDREWERIARWFPHLLPAEPVVRGMDYGVGARSDIPAEDRLRILGNGVVPQQAALALRILSGG